MITNVVWFLYVEFVTKDLEIQAKSCHYAKLCICKKLKRKDDIND